MPSPSRRRTPIKGKGRIDFRESRNEIPIVAIELENGVPGTDLGTGVAVDTAPQEGPVVHALVSALQGLHRAYQKLAMYPSGHPSVPEAIERAAARFDEVLAGRTCVVVRITRDDLIWNDERIGKLSDTLRSLAALLHTLDLAAVEFRHGLSNHQLELFVHLLAKARRDAVTGAGLVEALDQERVEFGDD